MLYILDTGQYKDMIAGRLRRQNGKGSWMVFQGCDEEYADQICSEEKILEKTGDQESWIWKPKASNIPNHYLDCEVYAALAADLMNVRYLTDEDRIKPVAEQPKQTTESSFIQTNGQWLDNAKNWRTNGQ